MASISKLKHILGWNDMNDSSQMSANSSDEQNFTNLQKRDSNNQSSSPQKIDNSNHSPQEPNQTKTKIRTKTAQGLQKLANHSEDNVWLYIFNKYEGNQDKITQILKENGDFIEVLVFAKGWNALIKTEKAKKYMEQLYSQKGYNIQFSFSTKNDKQGNKPKWNSKFKQDRFEDEPYSPKKGYNKNGNDKNGYQREYNEEKTKKKLKYVAKQAQSKIVLSPEFKEDHPTLTQKTSHEDQRQNQKNKNKIKNKKSQERFVDPNNPFSVFA